MSNSLRSCGLSETLLFYVCVNCAIANLIDISGLTVLCETKRNETKWYFAKWYFAKWYFAKEYFAKWYFAKRYFATWHRLGLHVHGISSIEFHRNSVRLSPIDLTPKSKI